MPNPRNRYLFLLDAALLVASVLLAYVLRFEGFSWGPLHDYTARVFLLVAVPLKLAIFIRLGLYRRLWRHAGVIELEEILQASVIVGLCSIAIGGMLLPWTGLTPLRVPYSVLLIDALLTTGILAFPRLMFRVLSGNSKSGGVVETHRVLIAGAGAAGGLIARELQGHPDLGLLPVGFVDDDKAKHRHRLRNLPVLGSLADIPRL
ncbi:MAG: hypothetical protein ABI765_03110, partial [Gemmatimonadota bacterium]